MNEPSQQLLVGSLYFTEITAVTFCSVTPRILEETNRYSHIAHASGTWSVMRARTNAHGKPAVLILIDPMILFLE